MKTNPQGNIHEYKVPGNNFTVLKEVTTVLKRTLSYDGLQNLLHSEAKIESNFHIMKYLRM